MSKRNFIALADAIKTANVSFTSEQLEVLADFCKAQNGMFNRERWFGYIAGQCGPSGGNVTRESVNRRYAR